MLLGICSSIRARYLLGVSPSSRGGTCRISLLIENEFCFDENAGVPGWLCAGDPYRGDCEPEFCLNLPKMLLKLLRPAVDVEVRQLLGRDGVGGTSSDLPERPLTDAIVDERGRKPAREPEYLAGDEDVDRADIIELLRRTADSAGAKDTVDACKADDEAGAADAAKAKVVAGSEDAELFA